MSSAATLNRSTTGRSLNPMQQHVIESLAKQPGWSPLPQHVVEGIRGLLHDGVAVFAEKLSNQQALWVTKHKLASAHGCEKHLMASHADFSWSINNIVGTIVHNAIKLAVNWRGHVIPAQIIEVSLDQLAQDDISSAGRFVSRLSRIDRALVRSSAIELFTKFDECFPPLKASWRPVVESCARYEMFDRLVNLSTRADLTLGAPGSKVVVEVVSGRAEQNHRLLLRYFALVETMRTGQAPRSLATYSLLTARPEVEEVTETVLQEAVRYVIDGIRILVELQHAGRKPTTNPGASCSWCPLANSCPQGKKYLG